MNEQHAVNNAVWTAAGEEVVAEYRAQPVRPVERLVLERYRAELTGHVLEIGIGGGRLTEELLRTASHVTGVDVAPAMIEHCRRRFPSGTFLEADLADLGVFDDGLFDAVVAGYNVIDVLGPEERVATLAEWRRVLAPGGLLVASTHNLHAAGSIRDAGRLVSRHPRVVLRNLRHRRLRIANHSRLAPFEQRGDGWAVLNDEAHHHSLLHFYAEREHMERQLRGQGFTLIECLALDGATVGPGEQAAHSPELHYCARSLPRP
jgi:SAM-dependent methyltransferase